MAASMTCPDFIAKVTWGHSDVVHFPLCHHSALGAVRKQEYSHARGLLPGIREYSTLLTPRMKIGICKLYFLISFAEVEKPGSLLVISAHRAVPHHRGIAAQ